MIDQKIALHLVFSLPSTMDMRCLAKLSDHWGLSFTAGVGLAAQALTSGRVGADPASLLAWVTLDPWTLVPIFVNLAVSSRGRSESPTW